MKKTSAFFALAVITALMLAACSNPAGAGQTTEPLSEKYTAATDGKTYELTITQSAANAKAAFNPAEGDSYVLKITENSVTQISSGIVKAFSGSKFTLTASINISVSFEVVISGSGIISITGTITFIGGATITGPGSISTGDGGGDGGGGNAGQIFTSWEALVAWLTAQPGNTKNNPYSAKVNVSSIPDKIGAVLNNANKYVNLDLSGSTITSIPGFAFYDTDTERGCARLTSITIPNSVTRIEPFAFQYCGLTSVTIPNSVTSIGGYAFSYCTSLASVIIGNGVSSIGWYAFAGCTNLASVTIPNSVISIGDYAFAECSGLASVTIPNSVISIGDYAFYSCTSLTGVTIPNSVTSIGGYAFAECSSLASVTIPNSVTSIGDYAF
jgi:predicted small secreted protein